MRFVSFTFTIFFIYIPSLSYAATLNELENRIAALEAKIIQRDNSKFVVLKKGAVLYEVATECKDFEPQKVVEHVTQTGTVRRYSALARKSYNVAVFEDLYAPKTLKESVTLTLVREIICANGTTFLVVFADSRNPVHTNALINETEYGTYGVLKVDSLTK